MSAFDPKRSLEMKPGNTRMPHRLSCVVIALLLSSVSLPIAAACVLPVPDGGNIEPSPASLVGEITSVAPAELVVRAANGAVTRVSMSDETGIWTVYGGWMEEAELRPGQHALIWFQRCARPDRGKGVAAVVEVCSLAPEPCPTRR